MNAGLPTKKVQLHREISVGTHHASPDFNPAPFFGDKMRLMIWGEPKQRGSFERALIKVSRDGQNAGDISPSYDHGKNAWMVYLPLADIGQSRKFAIVLDYDKQ